MKKHDWLTDHLGQFVTWLPVSSKVEAGLMSDFDGYIFKKSPVLKAAGPLPAIEEGCLSDPEQRESFVVQIFAWARLRRLPCQISALQAFHRDYKLLVMAHDPKAYVALGRIASNSERRPAKDAIQAYSGPFLKALKVPLRISTATNALQHMAGYFKSDLGPMEKRQLAGLIEEFRKGEAPLVAPMNLIRRLARKHHVEYLLTQSWFEPYPKGLRLAPAVSSVT